MTSKQASKLDINKPDAELPPIKYAPPPIKERLFTYSLSPYNKSLRRTVNCVCTTCKKEFKIPKWPINTSNLYEHYKRKHKDIATSKDTDYQDLASNNSDNSTNNSRATSTNNSFTTKPKPSTSSTSNRQALLTTNLQVVDSIEGRPMLKKRKSNLGYYTNEEFQNKLLKFILNSDLPFSIVNSPNFRELILYLKDEVKILSRQTIRRNFTTLFNDEILILKERLVKNNSRFALTLDEWKAGNNKDFLAITLHFVNKTFKLENYLIGFEALNKHDAYTGAIIYKIFDEVISDLRIRNRIIAITRDNAGPITTLIDEIKTNYKKSFAINIIDIRCAAHVLNITSNAFLTYVFFKPNNTIVYKNNLARLAKENPQFSIESLNSIRRLPNLLTSIINIVKYNHFFKNNFTRIVEAKKDAAKLALGPEKLLKANDTRWLSTYIMLDRFIWFSDEINEILVKARQLSKAKQKALKLDTFSISTYEWNYLINIRNILEIFRVPTIQFQAKDYFTNSWTIPRIANLIEKIEDKLDEDYIKSNPYIKFGLEQALTKVLEYYPIKDTNTLDKNNKTKTFNKLKDLLLVTLLNPFFKLNLFRKLNFSSQLIDEIREYFILIYRRYRIDYISSIDNTLITNESQITTSSSFDSSTISKTRDADDEKYLEAPSTTYKEFDEVEAYLNEAVLTKDSKEDISSYYYSNRIKRPILYTIARDYLAISTTSVPSESEFSKANNIVTQKRNKLLPDTIKKLAILKSLNKIPGEDLEYSRKEEEEEEEDVSISTSNNTIRTSSKSRYNYLILDDNQDSITDPIDIEDTRTTLRKGKERAIEVNYSEEIDLDKVDATLIDSSSSSVDSNSNYESNIDGESNSNNSNDNSNSEGEDSYIS